MDTPAPFLRWRWPVAFVTVLAWLQAIPLFGNPTQWAVWPGRWDHWWGMWSFQWRHASGEHLISNAIPLLALGVLFGSVYPKAAGRAWALFLLGIGPLVWLIGRPGPHVGASGIVYALFHALVAMAVLRRDRRSVASMFAATVVFAGLWLGVLNQEAGISWEGHLAGATLGWVAALCWYRRDPKPVPHVWEDEPEDNVNAPPLPGFVPTLAPPPPAGPSSLGHRPGPVEWSPRPPGWPPEPPPPP